MSQEFTSQHLSLVSNLPAVELGFGAETYQALCLQLELCTLALLRITFVNGA